MGNKFIAGRCLFLLMVITIYNSCRKEPKINEHTTVGIILYQGISNQDLGVISKSIAEYYGIHVKILSRQVLPKNAFINIKSPRYRADSIIAMQNRNLPVGIDYVLGITGRDISITKYDSKGAVRKPVWRYNDFGIMGLAYCPGKSCIVSDFRLKSNKKLHLERYKKVVMHELGHNFGLPHCTDKKCVMTDAVESIKTIDNANPFLCIKCQKRVIYKNI
jgi:archaemetzincin